MFTKLSREIIVAARAGGGDPGMNPRLRVAIERAKEVSMPKDNIDRSIKRGTGEIEGANYEEITYEGYGPGGSAIILECYSENRNRTVAEVRHAFTKRGGNMAENGSVSWQFKRVGQIIVNSKGINEDEFTLAALDAGAEDVVSEDGSYIAYTPFDQLHNASQALSKAGYNATEIGLIYLATNKATPTEADIDKLMDLLEALDELDDVQETYVNVDLPEMEDED